MRRLVIVGLIFTALVLIGRGAQTPSVWLLPYGPEQQPTQQAATVHTAPSQVWTANPPNPEVGEEETAAPILLGTTTSTTSVTTSTTATLFGITEDSLKSASDEVSSVPSTEVTEPLTDDDEPAPTTTVDWLVIKVVDGDTIELEGGERVRYIGIDTPESTTEHECYGEEAKARNRELVEGKRVTLVADAEDRDKYGRLLRYVYVDDTFINLTLAAEGYATQLTIPPNVAHADEFRAAVASAREQGNGLWSGCSAGEQNESSSRDRTNYNEMVPQAIVTDCPPDKPIKGNAQSMIYHMPGGDFYAKTKPEACFSTETDAKAAGYRKSRR